MSLEEFLSEFNSNFEITTIDDNGYSFAFTKLMGILLTLPSVFDKNRDDAYIIGPALSILIFNAIKQYNIENDLDEDSIPDGLEEVFHEINERVNSIHNSPFKKNKVKETSQPIKNKTKNTNMHSFQHLNSDELLDLVQVLYSCNYKNPEIQAFLQEVDSHIVPKLHRKGKNKFAYIIDYNNGDVDIANSFTEMYKYMNKLTEKEQENTSISCIVYGHNEKDYFIDIC